MKMLILCIVFGFFPACGQSIEEPSELDIVGGSQVYRSWYGSMERQNNLGHWCGATLIADGRWAITAEHCIPKKNPGIKRIRFGAYNKANVKNGGKPFDVISVTRTFKHPSLDLALLKLARKSKFNPMSLGSRSYSNGYKLHAFGMGNIAYDERNRKKLLLGVALKTKELRNPNPSLVYTEGSEGRGICFGDSGGPLLDPQRKQVVGVTSWTGSRCASVNGVDGFVKPDIQWINRTISRN